MNFYRIIAWSNLVTTPLAPAMLYAADVSTKLIDVGYPAELTYAAGVFAIVGIEGTGALTFHNALRAWREKSWGAMGLSVLFGAIYAVLMIAGIVMMDVKTGTVSMLVLLTIAAYLGTAVYEMFDGEKARKTETRRERTHERKAVREHELAMANANRLKINAQTRLNKSGEVFDGVQSNNRTPTKTKKITKIGLAVKVAMTDHPGAGVREISRVAGCAASTASSWMAHWSIEE